MEQALTVPQPRTIPLVYDARLGTVYKIWLLNIFLSILTFGIYNFWGKTKLRRYIARSFSVEGERFEYTGSPGEIFKGFAIAYVLFSILFIISETIGFILKNREAVGAAFTIVYFMLWQIGWYASMRYRLSRTTWKGVRSGLKGGWGNDAMGRFVKLKTGYFILNVLTLGLYISRSDRKIWHYVMDRISFGNQPVQYVKTEAEQKALFKTHLATLLLAIPTGGFSRLWYVGVLMRYKFGGVRAAGVETHATFSGSKHLGFVLGNWLVMIVTIGFARPYVIQRKMRYLSDHISFAGTLDTEFIAQAQDQGGGEGLDDVLGIDIGFF